METTGLDRLQALLAGHSMSPDGWWRLDQGEVAALLDEVREQAGAEDLNVRQQIWDALDRVVDEPNRDDLLALVITRFEAEQFRRVLTDTDPEVRRRTWRSHTVRGRFIEVVMQLLADEHFDYAWPDCIEMLRARTTFDTLVLALAGAPEDGLRKRLWVVLGLPADTRVPEFLPDHSCATLVQCTFCPESYDEVAIHECRHFPIVVTLLGSSLDEVRQQAMESLMVFGLGVVDTLRSIPRAHRKVRGGALAMLAEFGWHLLPPRDLMTLERLIRSKQHAETPEPLDFACFSGSWYALPTTDQNAVLDALDLRDPISVTLRMGFAPLRFTPWQRSHPMTMYLETWAGVHGFAEWNAEATRDAYLRDFYHQVFVTPALDGWTLVFHKTKALPAALDTPLEQQRLEMYLRMEQLSLRFGTAQWFEQLPDSYAPGECWSQWCLAQDGDIRMHCVSSGDVRIHRSDEIDPTAPLDRLYEWLETNGNPYGTHTAPADNDRVEAYVAMLRERDHERYLPDDEDELDSASTIQDLAFGARGASRRLSVNLEALGSHTCVQGTGVLAVPAHLRHRPRRGALPI
ncbi:hypothetical protein ACLMAJ_28960 [Nocardia sp. KC 131]|uniref:hypothetical protein n=1 Tax=Nocardia arseniciresistens TaxID=3392119 RepID=UPI00398EAADB